MRALLMHRDRDFVTVDEAPRSDGTSRVRDNTPAGPLEQALVQDLGLDILLRAMGGEDPVLLAMASRAVLRAAHDGLDTILYRQAILRDCLANAAMTRALYAVSVEAIEGRKKHWWGLGSRYPGYILHSSVDMLKMYMDSLRKLREIAERNAESVRSEGLRALFETLQRELDDEYFATVQRHLSQLAFRDGVMMSAELGPWNAGTGYVLREDEDKGHGWLRRILRRGPPGYTFRLHPRDEAGAQILGTLRDRAINEVANALGQSTEHVLGFFEILRAELAFYVGCLNLRDRLTAIGAPTCIPDPAPVGSRRRRYSGLYDVCLALAMGRPAVGNAHDADGKDLVVVTGANQGGKTTFLRAVGVAQLMMQSGMFVGADAYAAQVCTGLFTHFKREEDATMKSGKLDEELARMSAIADAVAPGALVLFNESFGATNEREGSEIARQVVTALLERRVQAVFVTHLFDFAQGLFAAKRDDTLFLRADRRPDGTRPYVLVREGPLETSFGEDLYREVFGEEAEPAPA